MKSPYTTPFIFFHTFEIFWPVKINGLPFNYCKSNKFWSPLILLKTNVCKLWKYFGLSNSMGLHIVNVIYNSPYSTKVKLIYTDIYTYLYWYELSRSSIFICFLFSMTTKLIKNSRTNSINSGTFFKLSQT